MAWIRAIIIDFRILRWITFNTFNTYRIPGNTYASRRHLAVGFTRCAGFSLISILHLIWWHRHYIGVRRLFAEDTPGVSLIYSLLLYEDSSHSIIVAYDHRFSLLYWQIAIDFWVILIHIARMLKLYTRAGCFLPQIFLDYRMQCHFAFDG